MHCFLVVAVLCAGIVDGQELPEDTSEIEFLTVDQAIPLSREWGWRPLSLDGLTTLSPEATAVLAKHEGRLNLSGLTTLSSEAATALAEHEGRLDLWGLKTLSDEALEALRLNPLIRSSLRWR